MAVLYIAEFSRMGAAKGHIAPIPQAPAIAEQQVAIGATSTQSAAFGGTTRFVEIHTDATCHVAIGADPTAATTTMRLAADETRYYGVVVGQKIAVITGT